MNGQARQGCAPNGGDMRYCRTNSHRPLTNAYSAERFGTAYRTNGSLTLPDGCACGHSRRLWPRGLQADGTDHGAHRQERRVVRAVADHRTGHIWTLLNEARDPGQTKPAALVAARGRRNDRRLPGRRPRVRRRRHDRAPEAASRACRRLPAARRTSPGQLATRPGIICRPVRLPAGHNCRQRRRDTARTRPLAGSRSMRLYAHRHHPGQSARRPGPAGCARYAPGQDAPERVCAGQGRTRQQPPEP